MQLLVLVDELLDRHADDIAGRALFGSYESDQLAKSVTVVGDRLYLGEGQALRVFSIDDPTSPALLGEYIFGLAAVVEIVGDYAVVGPEWRGVLVMDVRDPANLQTVARLDTADRPRGVDVVGDLVYVADQAGGLFVMRLVLDGP